MAMDLSDFIPKRTKLTLGGKEWTFAELTLGDFAEFRAELMSQRKKENAERRQQLIDTAEKLGNVDTMKLLEYLDKPISEQEIEDAMKTFDGLVFLAYLSLRHVHVGISREQVGQICTLGAIEEITAAMFPSEQAKKNTEAILKTGSDSVG